MIYKLWNVTTNRGVFPIFGEETTIRSHCKKLGFRVKRMEYIKFIRI